MNTTQENVERSIYEVIRLALVSQGYIADELLYLNNQAGWETAMAQIANTKGFAIDLFGVGSNQSKETKRVPRMVIITDRVAEGDIGTDYAPFLVTDPTQSLIQGQMALAPTETVNIQFNINLVCNSIMQERVCNSIIFMALGRKKYIPLYSDDTQLFFVVQTNYYNLVDTDEGTIEKAYVYEARDLYLEDSTVISTVVAINEITTNINISKSDLPTDSTNGSIQPDGNVHVNT